MSKKDLRGKPQYAGRVDIDACVRGVALVRTKIIDEIGKYGEDMDLEQVSPEELVDAILRHAIELQEDPYHCDAETGLPTLWHIQANAHFLERKRRFKEDGDLYKVIPVSNDNKSVCETVDNGMGNRSRSLDHIVSAESNS